MTTKQVSTTQLITTAESRLADLIRNKRLNIPKGLSPVNHLREAQLIIEASPAMKECDQTSIQHALLKIAILCLSPMKNQIYLIPYGNRLIAQESYFGNMTLVKRFCDVKDISNMVIYEDDLFEFEIIAGQYQRPTHKSAFKNMIKEKLCGAYTVITLSDHEKVDIMTKEEILRSWTMSKTYKADNKMNTHNKFSEEMFKRTVCNRACKPLLKSSSEYMDIEYLKMEQGIHTEIETNANEIDIDIKEPEKIEAKKEHIETKTKPKTKEEPLRINTLDDDVQIEEKVRSFEMSNNHKQEEIFETANALPDF